MTSSEARAVDGARAARRPRKRLTSEMIVSVAARRFGTSGYRNVSLREIATDLDVSHVALLRYFPTKEALLTAVLEARESPHNPENRFLTATGMEIFDVLLDLARQNSMHREYVEGYSMLLAEAADPGHPAHNYFTARFRLGRTTLTNAITTAQRAGQIRPEVDPAMAATTVLALMDGLQLHWLIGADIADNAAALEAYVSLIRTDMTRES